MRLEVTIMNEEEYYKLQARLMLAGHNRVYNGIAPCIHGIVRYHPHDDEILAHFVGDTNMMPLWKILQDIDRSVNDN